VVTNAVDVLADVRPWLDSLWLATQRIEEKDLALAQDNWDRRRALTNKEDAGQFIFDERYGKDFWEGKRVCLAIYCEGTSKVADKEYKEIKQRENQKAASETREEPVLNFYEKWPDLPLNTVIVDVSYHRKTRKPTVWNTCFRRFPALDIDRFKTENNEDSSLQIVQTESCLLEFPFGAREANAIEARLNEKVNGKRRFLHLLESSPEGPGSLVIPFSALFD
jgi:hypothetical protein